MQTTRCPVCQQVITVNPPGSTVPACPDCQSHQDNRPEDSPGIAGSSLTATKIDRTPSSPHPPRPPVSLITSGDLSAEQQTIGERSGQQRFQTVAHHANGGLGVISIANDLELGRRVALKQINPQYADDLELRARFVAEAEITGQLEHPGIVPVYGLGSSDSGRPFYAMRFIDGQSLKQAVDRYHAGLRSRRNPTVSVHSDNISFRRLIQALISVCQTIEYAHSRGVIHRDLKPANIMLGRFGETFVVDWGLARFPHAADSADISGRETLSLSADTEQTQPGTAKGTPAFMSPEQARGDTKQVGPVSDTYSLGATLYYVLSGQRPFAGESFHEILSAVCQGDCPAVERVTPGVPPPLAAVCRKAMRPEQRERYPTVRALADDLEAWLADERVSAMPPRLSDRIRRGLRRHPRMTASIATTLLISVMGLSSFAHVLSQKNAVLSAQAIALMAATQNETQARRLAADQKEIAADQSGLAFETLTVILDDVEARLRQLPQTGPIRIQILERILPALRQLSDDLVDQSLVDHRTIRSLLALGDATTRFAPDDQREPSHGNPPDINQSALKTTEAFYGLALETAESRTRESDSADAILDLATAARKYGEVSKRLGQTKTAVRHYEWCQQLVDQRLAQDGDSIALLLLSSAVRNDIGEIHHTQGNIRQAARLLEESVQHARRCGQIVRSDAFRDALAWALEERGRFLERLGQPAEALVSLDEALSLRQELTSGTDEQPDRSLIARTQTHRGQVLRKLGRLDEGEQALRASVRLWDSLAEDDPDNRFHTFNCSNAVLALSRLLDDRGHDRQAQRLLDRAIVLRRKLVDEFPDTTAYRHNLAVCLEEAGQQQAYDRQFETAARLYEEAITLLAELARHDPRNMQARQDLASAQQSMAKLLTAQDRPHEAIAIYRQCVQTMRTIHADKGDRTSQGRLASQLQGLGTALSKTGQAENSNQSFEEALRLRHDLVNSAAEQDQSLPRYSLGITLERHAQARERLRDLSGAQQQFEAACHVHRTLLSESPASLRYLRALMVTLSSLARVQDETGSPGGSLSARQECESLAARMVRLRPDEYRPREDHSIACRMLGETYRDRGQLKEAHQWLDRAVSCVQPLVLKGNSTSTACRTLATALEKRAEVEAQRQQHRAAISSYRQALALRSNLRDKHPDDGGNVRRIAVVQYETGQLYRAHCDYEAAACWLSDAASTLQTLIDAGADTPSLRPALRLFSSAAQRAQQEWLAFGDLHVLLASTSRLDVLLEKRALHSLQTEQWETAVEAALLIPGTGTTEARPLYNAACVLSRAANQSAPSRQHRLRLCACDALRAAMQSGFSDRKLLCTDSDLEGLRSLPQYRQLLEEAN